MSINIHNNDKFLNLDSTPEIDKWVIFIKLEAKKIKVVKKTIKQSDESETIVHVDGWNDKFALIVQRYFRKFHKFENMKDLNTIGNNETVIMNCGRIVMGRAISLKLFYLEERKRLRIILFEKATKRTQAFILENVNIIELNHNELLKNAWKIIEKIEYDKVLHQFFIGLEQSKNTEQSISVLSLTRHNNTRNKPQTNSFNFDFTDSREIYNGLKKSAVGYFNVKIVINSESKAEIFINNEKNSVRQRIEVKTSLESFFKLQSNEESIANLGRIIYSQIQSTQKGIIYFNEEEFTKEMLKYVFEERNRRLKIIQNKFRSHVIHDKLFLILTKAASMKRLVTKFALRIGKQYHFIKVFSERNKPGILTVRSDKAVNELKLKTEKIELGEDTDLSLIKESIKERVSSFIAYNSFENNLVFHKNGII